MKCSALHFLLVSVGALAWSTGASAAATAEQIASLGKDRTCMGAERAGNADGSIPEFTGKWFKTWPGQTKEYGYEPGPYVDEEPLFTITAENADEYAEQLTAGQKALLAKYPDDFRMKVYRTHRDFRFADWVCDIIKKNATEATIVDDGLGITGTTGAPPFPFPKSGLEAIWNVINPHRASTEQAVTDIANVYANGSIAWGRGKFATYNPGNDPDPAKRGSFTDHINAYFSLGFILPRRDRGFVAVGYQPNNFSQDATQSWQYIPGTRRVRQAPEVGFDTPVPPAGMRTVDDDYLFNGSPERYTWKLVGKKEFYVPFHNNRVNDPAIPYSELIKPNTINADFVRYEKRRVWVIEVS